MRADIDWRVPSSCGLIGIINRKGERFNGEAITRGIANLRERTNGLGGGFAAYGIYPEFREYYAFHVMFEKESAVEDTESFLERKFVIIKKEPIPVKDEVKPDHPILYRYFLSPPEGLKNEEDYVVDAVMYVNRNIPDAYVFSSGKDMGIFKGVGFPEEISRFYRLDEYEGYMWIAHGRFPTNSVAWWGGAHPFGILDWAVVHNGEISSYGINRRFLQHYGYYCTLSTDTEVMAYLFDLFVRKQGFDFEITGKILASPLWEKIEKMDGNRDFYRALRMVYGSALVNGPFAVIVTRNGVMVGLNDRIKLRPLVVGEEGEYALISSEEGAIREVFPEARVWMPPAGIPVVYRVKSDG